MENEDKKVKKVEDVEDVEENFEDEYTGEGDFEVFEEKFDYPLPEEFDEPLEENTEEKLFRFYYRHFNFFPDFKYSLLRDFVVEYLDYEKTCNVIQKPETFENLYNRLVLEKHALEQEKIRTLEQKVKDDLLKEELKKVEIKNKIIQEKQRLAAIATAEKAERDAIAKQESYEKFNKKLDKRVRAKIKKLGVDPENWDRVFVIREQEKKKMNSLNPEGDSKKNSQNLENKARKAAMRRRR